MDNIIQIAQKIEKAGGRLYLVGGAVRDEIIGVEVHDKDYCVVGLNKEELLKIIPEAFEIGKDFPVFLYNDCEFALARIERKVDSGYKGFEVQTNKYITIEQDLLRRDITINAIAKDVLTGDIVDPYGGIEDIKNKTIRPVSKAFYEDPLRAYRAARFAAKYDFKLSKEIVTMMGKIKEELSTLSAERVFEELKKALKTDKPSVFFKALRKARILDVHFKEINDLVGVVQPLQYHPEGDVFNHTMIVLDLVSSKTKDESTRFCALCHDLGKALTPEEVLPQHIGHDINGREPILALSNRLRLPNIWTKKAIFVSRYHMRAGRIKNMKPFKQAKLLYDIKKSVVSLEEMEIIINADDMLNRGYVDLCNTSKEINSRVNGDYLNKKGITVESLGKEKYLERLFTEQANIIKEIDSTK